MVGYKVLLIVILHGLANCSRLSNMCPQSTPCFCNNVGFHKSEIVVECVRKKLNSIPSFLGVGVVKKINLASNRINDVMAFDFKGITTAQIDFSHNSISSLDENAFSGMETKLEILELKYNKFTEIPSKSLKRLKKLMVLNFDNNVRLEVLKSLDFTGLDNLEKLSLKGCSISVIEPDSFLGLSNLKELILYENNLQNISSKIFQPLKNLGKLDLGFNGLQYIPARAFTNVNSLSLSMNNFSSEASFDAVSFEGVSKTLTYLSLAHCRMTSIPKQALKVLGELEHLKLSGNLIQKLDREDFHGLSSLEHLTLDNNSRLQFSPQALSLTGNTLRYLSMRDMNMRQLPLPVLQDLLALEWLDISDNRFDTFGAKSFEGVCARRYEITHTTLRYISAQAFKNTPNELYVNLQGNVITDVGFLDIPCKFKEVNIDVNCDCELFKLLSKRKLQITGKCRLPHDLESLPISSQEYRKMSKQMCASGKPSLGNNDTVCSNFDQSEGGKFSPRRCLSVRSSLKGTMSSSAHATFNLYCSLFMFFNLLVFFV